MRRDLQRAGLQGIASFIFSYTITQPSGLPHEVILGLKNKVLAFVIVCFGSLNTVAAQKQITGLPKADSRWKELLPGVQFDSQTFKAITVSDSENDGRRFTNVWLRYLSESKLLLVNWQGFCDDRDFAMYEMVTTDSTGIQKKWTGFSKIELHPNSSWESVFVEVFKRSKPWWKAW